MEKERFSPYWVIYACKKTLPPFLLACASVSCFLKKKLFLTWVVSGRNETAVKMVVLFLFSSFMMVKEVCTEIAEHDSAPK